MNEAKSVTKKTRAEDSATCFARHEEATEHAQRHAVGHAPNQLYVITVKSGASQPLQAPAINYVQLH